MSDQTIDPAAQPMVATKPIVIPFFFKNYFAFIKNSANTEMFRNWYCTVNGIEEDVIKDGNFGCALYAMSILKLFSLVSEIQITVHRAIAEMERNGWTVIAEAKPGAVVIWDARPSEKDANWASSKAKHIGFCLGDNLAVSTSDIEKKVVIHPIDIRPILTYYWHPKLEQA